MQLVGEDDEDEDEDAMRDGVVAKVTDNTSSSRTTHPIIHSLARSSPQQQRVMYEKTATSTTVCCCVALEHQYWQWMHDDSRVPADGALLLQSSLQAARCQGKHVQTTAQRMHTVKRRKRQQSSCVICSFLFRATSSPRSVN